MALKRFEIDGFGQIELNQVAFRRDGRIEAQCKLDADTFSATTPAENGMILAVDNVKRLIKFPAENDDGLYAINYSTEHMYEDRANALKDFSLVPGTFLPRLGYLAKGDKFTTNCLCYEETDFANEEAVIEDFETNGLYGTISEIGAIKLVSGSGDKPTGLVLRVIKKTTMPDGQFAFKFHVIAE